MEWALVYRRKRASTRWGDGMKLKTEVRRLGAIRTALAAGQPSWQDVDELRALKTLYSEVIALEGLRGHWAYGEYGGERA